MSVLSLLISPTHHRIFECDTFWVVFGEPTFGRILIGKDLEVVDVASLVVST